MLAASFDLFERRGDLSEDLQVELPGCTPIQTENAVRSVLAALCDNLPAWTTLRLAEMMPRKVCNGILGICHTPQPVIVESEPGSLVLAVAGRLPADFPQHACLVVRVVLAAVTAQIGSAEATKLSSALPSHFQKLWPRDVWRPQVA